VSLTPHEREFMERFASLPNPLGWKPAGRDEDGVAQMQCVTHGQGTMTVTIMKITEKGLVYSHRRYIYDG
jgi:hypothetical protein